MEDYLKNSFLNPPDEFTPIPFWFWNDDLKEEEIIRQIHDFNNKGVKGFVIHPRMGVPAEIGYLSDLFMELAACAVKEAETLGMKVVLYDEAMYPSGSAHGMVVRKFPEYASRGLRMTEYKCTGSLHLKLSPEEKECLISALAVKRTAGNEIITESITKLKAEEGRIEFDPKGEDAWSVLLFTECFTGGHIRGIHFGEDDGEENAPPSADLLNRQAVEEFIRLTHERYYEVLKDYFGTTVIGMFTDEPDIMGRGHEGGLIPWTTGFLDYLGEGGISEYNLPLLWFEDRDTCREVRRCYQEAVDRKMEEAYYQPLYEWCGSHGIALTGHPGKSDDIGFLKYFHMPAQDVVWRWVAPEGGRAVQGEHSTMAKCSSDSAKHRGKRRNGNECFACCGKDGIEWSFSADDMKWYMDWLFVRGVNLLYPHAFFYSIDGPRRIGERPPDVGPNNIWWPYYRQISDYIKRMCWVMTDSVNQARTAVLCEGHHLPWQITKPLYENQIEFNYLENELLVSGDCRIEDGLLKIRNQKYRVLVLEDITLINSRNKGKLQDFLNAGGKVIVYNPESKQTEPGESISISSFEEVAAAVSGLILRDAVTEKKEKDLRLSHFIKEDEEYFLFVNEGEEKIDTKIRLSSAGAVEKWDAFEGAIYSLPVIRCTGESSMELRLKMNRRESLLLHIDKSREPKLLEEKDWGDQKEISCQVITLDKDWYTGRDLWYLEREEKLTLWNEKAEYRNYSGRMFYKIQFHVPQEMAGKRMELDLGDVYEIAEVIVNGREAGVRMWAPYIFPLEDSITEGLNELVIEVHNTLANKICNAGLKSGLAGPVTLRFYENGPVGAES